MLASCVRSPWRWRPSRWPYPPRARAATRRSHTSSARGPRSSISEARFVSRSSSRGVDLRAGAVTAGSSRSEGGSSVALDYKRRSSRGRRQARPRRTRSRTGRSCSGRRKARAPWSTRSGEQRPSPGDRTASLLSAARSATCPAACPSIRRCGSGGTARCDEWQVPYAACSCRSLPASLQTAGSCGGQTSRAPGRSPPTGCRCTRIGTGSPRRWSSRTSSFVAGVTSRSWRVATASRPMASGSCSTDAMFRTTRRDHGCRRRVRRRASW